VRDTQLKHPARLSAPANQTPGVRSVTTVAVAPTRAEITTAYQSALQTRAPAAAAPVAARPVAAAAPVAALPDAASPVARPVAAAPVAASPVAAPSARRLDADELATLMNRAKGLLAAGDIPPARLLLERAADAQEPSAALLLARTYDPEVLGTQDIRNITPDPAMARLWYQKAAQFGSADAERRLTQLQN
jgi:TPR repeat protein